MISKEEILRFENNINLQSNGCKFYIGCKDKGGYGRHWDKDKKKMVRAHRYIYEHYYGPIPEGMVIAHHCDQPSCCEISHLFLTDNKGNSRDMVEKGRASRHRKGKKASEETRLKISIARTGCKLSDDEKIKISKRLIGNKYSLGHKHTEEFRKKVSARLIGNKHTLGRKLSEDHKLKIILANKGRIVSDETRLKISKIHSGKIVSEETRLKIGKTSLGRIPSEEARKKMSISGKLRWQKAKQLSFQADCVTTPKTATEIEEKI